VLQQIPDRNALAAGRVVIAVRQLIPVFAMGENLTPPQLSAALTSGGLLVQNSGGRRARISRVTQDNRVLASGLLGYALGGTTTRLLVPSLRPGRIEIETDLGVRSLDVR
jgi:P pilus assembly chaperone PapD